MEITTYDPPARIAATWFEPMAGRWLASFQEVDASTTQMDFTATIEPSGLMGLLEPLMRPWARRQVVRSLGSFRDWVEGGGCRRSG